MQRQAQSLSYCNKINVLFSNSDMALLDRLADYLVMQPRLCYLLDITTKHSSLDILNRELRQVNLQQFIRKTGSKVTVLPPETESEDKRRKFLKAI